MNALVARLPRPETATVDAQQWRVLTEVIWPGAKTAEAVILALDYCRTRKLDPFKRPVHIVPVWNSALGRMVETLWPGISELQTTAARTGQWAGMDPPEWGPVRRRTFEGLVGKQGQERPVAVTIECPEWCAVTVYRIIAGQRCAFSEPVYWDEAYARIGRTTVPNEMWSKRPRGQLHKVAKAASLRAAFPEENGNDYTAEEMEGATIEHGGVVIDGTAEPPQEPALQQLQAAKQDHDAAKPRLTQAQFLDGLDSELRLAPDADAVQALLTSSRVASATEHFTGAPAERLAGWIARAHARQQALRDDAAEVAVPAMDSTDDWPLADDVMAQA